MPTARRGAVTVDWTSTRSSSRLSILSNPLTSSTPVSPGPTASATTTIWAGSVVGVRGVVVRIATMKATASAPVASSTSHWARSVTMMSSTKPAEMEAVA